MRIFKVVKKDLISKMLEIKSQVFFLYCSRVIYDVIVYIIVCNILIFFKLRFCLFYFQVVCVRYYSLFMVRLQGVNDGVLRVVQLVGFGVVSEYREFFFLSYFILRAVGKLQVSRREERGRQREVGMQFLEGEVGKQRKIQRTAFEKQIQRWLGGGMKKQ